MAVDNNAFLMVTSTGEIIKTIDLMALAAMFGAVEPPTKVVSETDCVMVKENGQVGKLSIQVAMLKDSNKATESYIFHQVTFTKATLLRISVRDMEKCFGQMVLSTKGNGKEVFKTERDRSIWLEEKLLVDYLKTAF